MPRKHSLLLGHDTKFNLPVSVRAPRGRGGYVHPKFSSRTGRFFFPATMSFYRDTYLKSDHWQNLRLKKLAIEDACCNLCHTRNLSNDLHHVRYRKLWDVRPSDLRVLCRRCHDIVHEVLDGQSPAQIARWSSSERWRHTRHVAQKILRARVRFEKLRRTRKKRRARNQLKRTSGNNAAIQSKTLSLHTP